MPTFSVETNTKQQAQSKMEELSAIITKAQKKGINTLREETALRTAEFFMIYADWDEKNVDFNVEQFGRVIKYQDEKEKYARLLPEFQRSEILKMMNSSIEGLQSVLDGKSKRLNSPKVDWKYVTIEGDEMEYEGRPVFITDWNFKAESKKYTEYHGNQSGFFLTPSYVINEEGDLNPHIMKSLQEKPAEGAGYIFFNHTSFPKWAVEKDPTVNDGPGLSYTKYDINNPLARDVQSKLIKAVVPYTRGKNFSRFGYMLCNEPHWNTIENSWAASPLSEHAYAAFRTWLKERHGNIEKLNSLWGTNYADFESIDGSRMMKASEQGTPEYFDFMSFNQDRVTDWFSFMRSEIRKYDPNALTHVKVMPEFWSDGLRDHGLDMEALVYNTEIIGHDASSGEQWMWGKPFAWEKNYKMDWKEICMAQDFFKSVSPEKIMFNTESHFLSTGKQRDLYMTPEYVRCNFWLATIHGMTASQNWFWYRCEDGSPRNSYEGSNAYAASANHQPRIINEAHATIIDLNSVSEEIMTFQRQRKSIRVFYSKASAINDIAYADDLFANYESLVFDGIPVGFATQGIINKNKHDWDVITIYKTPRAFKSDIEALQSYLDEGGTVIMDTESLAYDEYNRSHSNKLNSSKGELIVVNSLNELQEKALSKVLKSKNAPALVVSQDNGSEQPGALWRVIDGKKQSHLMTISNIGKKASTIDITLRNGKGVKLVTDYLTGKKIELPIVMQPYDTYLLKIEEDRARLFSSILLDSKEQ